ncbi:thaumatin-like protein 1 [Oryza brachyantha]|uniref:thaumatin-like protein 1 n=1 Tax=Oryza brachyantha TaxID=4533 RepID=UPI001ADC41C5|nr:thaumatin-like protein 1 [Oryza brachyantha]
MGELLPVLSLLLCLSLLQGAQAATFTVSNQCGYTVWPGILSNAGVAPPSTTGFALSPGQTLAVSVAAAWSGRIWGRTLCGQDSSGRFTCATGDCGSGAVECSGRGAAPPATLAEFTLGGGSGGGDDFYDVSLVDGYNLPMLVAPTSPAAAASNGSCQVTGCVMDLNKSCPAELQVVVAPSARARAVAACKSACEAFGTAQYCCSGAYAAPSTCAPTAYSRFFKGACPRAYSYAYDDATSTFTCAAAGGGYDVVFCPGASSNPEAVGVPPTYSTIAFTGNAESLATSRVNLLVIFGLVMVISSAMPTLPW